MPGLPDPLQGNRVELTFGGGLNTVRHEAEINPRECTEGYNFDLSVDNSLFSRRRSFDLTATAPNAEAINGYAQLVTSADAITTLIQAGTNVYSWDGATTFTLVGTVAAGARIRGPKQAIWTAGDLVLIGDLSLVQPVMQWDGTTLSNIAHNLANPFYAKYVLVQNERAFYGSIKSGATPTTTRHMIAASVIGDHDSLDVSNKPSSALAADAAFYLLTPDFRAVNGLIDAFGLTTISSERGRIYKFTGTSAKDFAIAQLYPGSGASGDEPLAYIGNDIVFARPGAIETLFASEALGDVETDNLSRPIASLIEEIDNWNIAYNPRFQKIYFAAVDTSRFLVFHKSFMDERIRQIAQRRDVPDISPWVEWRTDHSMNMQPVTMFTIRRPTDGLECTYMGGSAGQIWQLEGEGGKDNGSEDVYCTRTSKVFRVPGESKVFNLKGWVSYRLNFTATLTVELLHGGRVQRDQSFTVTLAASPNAPVFGGAVYFGGSIYFGAQFAGRFDRKQFDPTGDMEEFQIRLTVDGSSDFFIERVWIEFPSAGAAG